MERKRITIGEESMNELTTQSGHMDLGSALVPVQDPTENHRLFELVQASASPSEIFDQVMVSAATEIAYLQQSRALAHRAGANFANISEKTIRGLKTLADLSNMKGKELSQYMHGDIDFDSDGFKAVMSYMFHMVKEAMRSASVSSSQQKVMLTSLQASLMGFEDNAKRLYSGASLDEIINKKSDKETRL